MNDYTNPLTPDPLATPSAESISLDDYRRRAALGEFSVSGAVELLEGKIVPKARQTLRHEGALERLQEILGRMIPNGWHLRVQQPLATVDSQPEPDIAVACNTLDGYVNRPPRAEEIALVIEAADASLLLDRRSKGRVYARAGIINYWVLNLLDSQLEVFTNPSGPKMMPGFQEQRIYRGDDRISLVIGLDDLGTIRIADMIP